MKYKNRVDGNAFPNMINEIHKYTKKNKNTKNTVDGNAFPDMINETFFLLLCSPINSFHFRD